MNRGGPRHIADVLQSGDISQLRREAERRRTLLERVRARLPAAEAEHLIGAHVEPGGRLVVSMDSAAWAARVRYVGVEIDGVGASIKVAPPAGTRR